MKNCNASRVIEPRKHSGRRSANLVGETKVDRGNLSFPQMCAEGNALDESTPKVFGVKSPLMASAQQANHHDAVLVYPF
jgi:hypothetical protein